MRGVFLAMTTIHVKAHDRKAPAKKPDPLQDLIDARYAARKARAERFEASRPVSYPRVFRAIADAFRSWRG